MTLCESHSLFIPDQRAMVEGGSLPSQSAEKQQLTKRRAYEIRPSHHFSDGEQGIIHHARKLVAGQSVFPPDQEVAEVPAGDSGLGALSAIVEGQLLSVRNTKPPVLTRAIPQRWNVGTRRRSK